MYIEEYEHSFISFSHFDGAISTKCDKVMPQLALLAAAARYYLSFPGHIQIFITGLSMLKRQIV